MASMKLYAVQNRRRDYSVCGWKREFAREISELEVALLDTV